MKRPLQILSAVLASCVIFGTVTACKKKPSSSGVNIGVLSFLNQSEEKSTDIFKARIDVLTQLVVNGYARRIPSIPEMVPANSNVRYYDTLDSLLMALKSGEITTIQGLSQTTATYLCAKNKDLNIVCQFELKKPRTRHSFEESAINRLSDGYSFMMLEKNTALRDQFNTVIADMEADGSLKQLIRSQIIDAVDGHELTPVIPEEKRGRETIRVAVTGALPPMDYVASDGTFAGFNTALLAEIGRRLDKNISIIQVSSMGRAAALASGTVDVVFWTRSSVFASNSLDQGLAEYRAEVEKNMSTTELQAMQGLTKAQTGTFDGDPRKASFAKDMPEGTIITIPYFKDVIVGVTLK